MSVALSLGESVCMCVCVRARGVCARERARERDRAREGGRESIQAEIIRRVGHYWKKATDESRKKRNTN